MTEMNVSTDALTRGCIVRDRTGRVLIVNKIEDLNIPGTNQRGFILELSDPRNGMVVRHTASTQSRWTLWKS